MIFSNVTFHRGFAHHGFNSQQQRIKKLKTKVGDVGKLTGCLLSMLGALGSNFWTTKMECAGACLYLQHWRSRGKRIKVQSSWLYVEFKDSLGCRRPCLEKKTCNTTTTNSIYLPIYLMYAILYGI